MLVKITTKDLDYILRQNMYSMYDLFLKCYS